MKINDLELHEICIGLKIKSLVSEDWGTIFDINISNDYFCRVKWDHDKQESGFHWNDCECEVDEKSIKPWALFTGECRKMFHFIKLKDGKIYGPCWPNASTFHTLYMSEDRKVIPVKEVSYIKEIIDK